MTNIISGLAFSKLNYCGLKQKAGQMHLRSVCLFVLCCTVSLACKTVNKNAASTSSMYMRFEDKEPGTNPTLSYSLSTPGNFNRIISSALSSSSLHIL